MNIEKKCIAYENKIGRTQLFQNILRPSTKDLIAKARLLPGETVLDIGCGNGDVTLMLAEKVGDNGIVYALDMSKEKLLRLSERAVSSGINNIRLVHGSAEDILPSLGVIDVVYCRFVLMHLNKPSRVLNLIQLILSENGRAIFEEPIIHTTYDYPLSGVWEKAITAYRKLCRLENIDPDYGLKLFPDMVENCFRVVFSQQIQPILSIEVGREYLISAVESQRENYLKNGVLTFNEYNELLETVSFYGESRGDYCAFHGVMQIIGKKV